MISARFVAFGVAVAATAICFPAEAQTLYRCGKSFQDRPCDSAAPGKAVSTGASAPQTTAGSTASSLACAQRGENAKRIAWAREVGKTRDEQLAGSTSPDHRNLIAEVYQMRGNAYEVSAAVEAKCAEKEKEARAAAAAITLLQEQAAASPTAGNSGERTSPANQQAANQQESANSAAKKERCDGFASQLQGLQDNERAGGSASQMDSLKKQRRDIEAKRQAAAC